MSQERDFITIVSGLPRSGTSMMMRMIDQGGIPAMTDGVRVADEDNPMGYFEFEAVKKTKEDDAWVETAYGRVVKLVHLILLELPLPHDYRVVFMRRNLDEVVKSQNVMLERHGKETAGLPEAKLKAIYLSQIAKVQDYMKQNADHFRFIEVDYNQALKDPQPQAERIDQFLGGGMDIAKMVAVVNPALYRNRA